MDGIQVDLHVLPPARWGTGLQFFTGSHAHNVRIRALAKEKGFLLSELGFHGEGIADVICAGEEAVYKTLGLPWIPPELREDRGEVKAALEGRLPALVKRGDLLGDFQCHSTYSGGDHSLMEMAQAAQNVGLRYLVIADHANGATNGQGLALADLDVFLEEIARVNAWFRGEFQVIPGVEVNIKSDGTLEWPDAALSRLNFVIAAIHTDFNLSKELMTQRVLTALKNPFVDMLGHPTGRLLGRRASIALDIETVFQAAATYGTALEINAWPQRLDLNDVYIRRAVELGVPLAISSDSHDVEGFAVLDFGVAMARRGWAEPQHLLNALSGDDVLAWRQERLQQRQQ
jgi:DNA polymerase (family 10)